MSTKKNSDHVPPNVTVSQSFCSQSDNNVSPNHKNTPYFLNDLSWYLATQIVVVSFADV